MESDVLITLKELNFTEYEAKAYLALLEQSPLTGYAVSLHSGVPRSKIYEVLGGMVNRGDILASPENTPRYIPLSPTELITRRKQHADQIFSTAQLALEQYAKSAEHRDSIWNLTGRESIFGQMKEAVKQAKHRVLLEAWSEDVEELRGTLEEAAKRGIKILIVLYGESEIDFAQVYRHDLSGQITTEYGGRWVVLSVDDREVVAGIVSQGNESRAAWTTHPGLVMPITEVIIHDLYIHEIMKDFRGVLEERFGPNLCELRNRFVIEPFGKHYNRT